MSREDRKRRAAEEAARVAALHEALREELSRRMTAEGWLPDQAESTSLDDGVVGSFRHPVAEDFAATAWFAWLGDYPPLKVCSNVGLSYERSYPVWPMLVGRSRAELHAEPGSMPATWVEEVELWELDEVTSAVDRMISPVLEGAVSWAEPLASVDAMVDKLHATDDDLAETEIIPVILASAGRLAEAKEALSGALKSHPAVVGDEFEAEFVQKLTEWLEGGAVLPDPPSAPIPQEPSYPNTFDMEAAKAEARERSEQRKQAIESARRQREGRSRDELRSILKAELDARNVSTSPRDLEMVLDGLEATTRSEKRRLQVDAGKMLFGVVRGVVAAIRTKDSTGEEVPEEFRLPPDAAFPVATDHRQWRAVKLGAGVESFIERIIESTSTGPDGSHQVNSWMSTGDGVHIDVYIGRQVVGSLDSEASAEYREHLETATELGLHAVVRARVTKRRLDPRYVLEVAAPTQSA
jgi:hypothetical protein